MLRSRIFLALATAVLVSVSVAATQDAKAPAVGTRKLELIAEDKQAVPGWLRQPQPEGTTLHDEEWVKTANAVVLLHMFRSDHAAWEPILSEFDKRGITTLAIDMRGHGENLKGPEGEDLQSKVRGRDADTFRAMYRDANAAIDWLVEHGYSADRIGLLGASVGCSVAIDTARRRDEHGPVGVLTPGLNYLGVNSEEHIRSWGTRDLLIVTSEEEAEGGPAPLRAALNEQFEARRKREPKTEDHVTYWVLKEESVHGTRMFGSVKGIEARVANWFEEHFKPLTKKAPEKATSRPTDR